MSAIEVNHVTKEFQLGQLHGIKLSLQRGLARLAGKSVPPKHNFKALDDVSFEVAEGEVVGIIGENGAGKSTLLKLLSRITVPTRGSVTIRGKVAPLIEVGSGLIGDLSGRENIYLNAAIMGMRRAEIKKRFDEIVAFAELEEFIDTPLKRYSSGMAIRLAFSIAINVEADILIIDEVLAVGDLAFQRKCFDRMEEIIKRQRKTVLLVSHNVRQVERLCTRAILLDHGRILRDAGASETCNLFYERSDEKIKKNAATALTGRRMTSGEIDLLEVQMFDDSGLPTNNIIYEAPVTVVLKYKVNVPVKKAVFGVGVHTTDFVYLATDHSDDYSMDMAPGLYAIRCTIKRFPFLPGTYALRVGIAGGEFSRAVFYAENAFFFRVSTREGKRTQRMHEGVVSWESQWSGGRLEHEDVSAALTESSAPTHHLDCYRNEVPSSGRLDSGHEGVRGFPGMSVT
jgi:ABC-type polysaccharide/polyol phosphate transport system ATPase subunit